MGFRWWLCVFAGLIVGVVVVAALAPSELVAVREPVSAELAAFGGLVISGLAFDGSYAFAGPTSAELMAS